MLRECGIEPPPANHPPKTRQQQKKEGEGALPSKADCLYEASTPDAHFGSYHQVSEPMTKPSQHNLGGQHDHGGESGVLTITQESATARTPGDNTEAENVGSPTLLPPPKNARMVSRLLSTRGHLSFDQLSGRLRYFGPTTNCHVHSDPDHSNKSIDIDHNQLAKRAEEIISSLSHETYNYLMDLFWAYYNSVLHVLHQEAFNEDREQGRTQFYSSFLHICVLAMGFRFADKQRPDIQRLALPNKESILHREAKCMLDHELERSGGIPSIVALLLLGCLECGVGRDTLGWLYAGMAVRLAFDIGFVMNPLKVPKC